MDSLAVAILDSAAHSTEIIKRRNAAASVPMVYELGYYQLHDTIVELLTDDSLQVQKDIYRVIKIYQDRYNKLREFNLNE